MWLSIIASILSIGAAMALVYLIYLKIHHPDVVFSSRKNILDFIQDSLASLIQSEAPPVFVKKSTLSAGFDSFCRVFEAIVVF